MERSNNQLTLNWSIPSYFEFNMPVQVTIGDETKMIDMNEEKAILNIHPKDKIVVDPEHWILKKITEEAGN